ncbi:MAG: hypothetical protein WBG10_07260 [Pseudolabrys sp.]
MTDLNPSMRSEQTVLACDSQTKLARQAATAQHRMGSQSLRQAKGIHPRSCGDTLNRPSYPWYFIDSEAVNMARRFVGPRDNP